MVIEPEEVAGTITREVEAVETDDVRGRGD